MDERGFYTRVTQSGNESSEVTQVSVVDSVDDGTIDATWVEREYFRTQWGYNRAISKEVKRSISLMGYYAVARARQDAIPS